MATIKLDHPLRVIITLKPGHTGSVHINAEPLSDESAYNLRQCFSIAKGRFTAFLIGKDGRIKPRQNGRFDLGDIFDLIDTLPMRPR